MTRKRKPYALSALLPPPAAPALASPAAATSGAVGNEWELPQSGVADSSSPGGGGGNEFQAPQSRASTSDSAATGVSDAGVIPPSQAVPLVGVPNYPSCIKWSEENLLAVAAGHIVTILDPASLSGPRGFIPVSTSPLFDFGKVSSEDLQAHSLLQFCLARDPRPGVRSIDWSPPGLAQNGGCLLAVCTTDSRVKVYRAPFCDFQSEWVEIIDLSEMIYNYCLENDFREADIGAARLALEEEEISPPLQWGFKLKRKISDDDEPQHRKVQKTKHRLVGRTVGGMDLVVAPVSLEILPTSEFDQPPALHGELEVASNAEGVLHSSFEKGSRVEVREEDDGLQYWVGASVVEIVDGEALVRLDHPQYGAMQEWVPLKQGAFTDDACADETENPKLADSFRQEDGKQILATQRPRIRPLLVADTLVKSMTDNEGNKISLTGGELVEAWVNHRWQEGLVVGLEGSGIIVKFSGTCTNVVMELDKLRLAPFWNGKRWMCKTPATFFNHVKARVDHGSDSTHFPMGVQSSGQNLPDDFRDKQDVEYGDSLSRDLGCSNEVGEVRANFTVDIRPENTSSHVMSRAEQCSPLAEDAGQINCSKVYKRRGLVSRPCLPIAVARSTPTPPTNSCNSEKLLIRPVRNKRLPSKFRDAEMTSFVAEMDNSVVLGSDAQSRGQSQVRDVDYVPEVRVVKNVDKAKQVRFVKDKDTEKPANNIEGIVISEVVRSARPDHAEEHMQRGKSMDSKFISAPNFAARSDIVTPLVLAWSSRYQVPCAADGNLQGRCQKFALLGGGMKSGRVSLWRMTCPSSYSIDHARTTVASSFLGFLSAHESWVTSLSWASCCDFDLRKLNPRVCPGGGGRLGETLLLATGCSDGSVKIWAGRSRELSGPLSPNQSVPFSFLRDVVKVDCVPVTSLALIVPHNSGGRALLAVGKGSGSVAIWELKSSGIFGQICSQVVAHQQMVTGFSWTYDGRCLYSCGQDSLKRWDFSKDQLLPLPFPDGSSVFPPNIAPDLCSWEALESFFGVALSHNGLALVVVRGIASDLLDQMYQARSQKGMVQLFWLGSEHIDVKRDGIVANVAYAPKALSVHDKICWELNIVAALEHLQDPTETLVLWDVIVALSSLKEKIGIESVLSILSKWLSSWSPGQGAVGAVSSNEWESFQKAIPQASCRKLQILNVIYRRFLLSHFKPEVLSAHSSEEISVHKDVETELTLQVKLWKDGIYLVEHDLRQRLVHFCLYSASCGGMSLDNCAQGDNWIEINLLVKWVLDNVMLMFPQLVKMAMRLRSTKIALPVNSPGSSFKENCIFCESTVLFESPETASCQGSDSIAGPSKHYLQRCSVSMQVCPPICLWHCGCCARSAVKQASSLFFSLPSRAHTVEFLTPLPLPNDSDAFPSCPFCGILMHRLLPNFFLTPSLV